MPPALWLIVLLVGAVPVVYLLRRLGLGAVVAAGVALASAWLALRLPLGLVLNVLGRSLELDRLSQVTLSLLFAATAVLFLIAFPFTPFIRGRNRGINTGDSSRGRTFHPVGLATLAFFVAASLTHHLGITAILIQSAALLAVFVIQGRRLESTRAAQRFLVLMSLATPLFLLAAWRIDQYQLSGGLQPISYLQQTTLLVGLGFALWLAVVPFHNWLTVTAAEASPSAAAFVLITFPIVAFSILMHTLADLPWLLETSPLAWVMVLAGVLTALVGGALASVQRGFSLLLGYAALYDLGCTLAVLGVGGEAAVITILVSLTVRALALALIAACLSAIRLQTAYDGFAEIRGLARRLPVATVGLVVGGLTLAGAPLTIGFPLRWQLLQAIAGVDSRWPILLTLAGLGVAIGYLRGFRALLLSPIAPNKKERSPADAALTLQEPFLLLIIIALLAAACIVFGLFPSLLIEPIQELSVGIEIPIR
jgi:formate hydrogenlyase subunit 3/multisubunit Na+/H+ antiporter MnhD subunit